jgi:lysophospholipase L1-like esterase
VLLGALTGLALVETGLRYFSGYVQSREQMDPGFLVYDARLGWRMAPNWRGRHIHYDFDVHYSTNAEGLRGSDWPAPAAVGRPRVAIMGDSFTFGLGANEEDTFVARIGAADPGTLYLNAGIAGYSTDQQLLYLQERLESWRLKRLVLVVYLANDLLDNPLRFPLQAEMGKPLFVAGPTGLVLTNVPVPQVPKPLGERARTLATEALGRNPPPTWQNEWQLTRTLGLADAADPALLAGMPERLAGPVELFVRLIAEVRALCAANDVALTLVLMPGRSFVEAPDSLSAAFQDELRRQILARQAELGAPLLDIATPLAVLYANSGETLFHPHEGHLNPEGHQAVAELLLGALDPRGAP